MGIQTDSILEPKGNFPLADGKHLTGVTIVVKEEQIRDDLPSFIRIWGMLVYVSATKKFYELVSGTSSTNLTDNANWIEADIGGSVEPQNGLKSIAGGIGLGGNIDQDTIIQSPAGSRLGFGTSFPFKALDFRAIDTIFNTTNSTSINSGNMALTSQTILLLSSNADMLFIGNSNMTLQAIGTIFLQGNKISLSSDEVRMNASIFYNDAFYNKLPERNAASLINNKANLIYDTVTNRVTWNDGNRVHYCATLEDVSRKLNYTISFGQKNWVGANTLLKTNDVADLVFHTVKRVSHIKSIVLNAGEIDSTDFAKQVTVVIYTLRGFEWYSNSERVRTMSEILSTPTFKQVYSMTTSITGSSSNSTSNFQRIFENLNINVSAYHQIYVGITTNETTTLNNFNVTLEIEDI